MIGSCGYIDTGCALWYDDLITGLCRAYALSRLLRRHEAVTCCGLRQLLKNSYRWFQQSSASHLPYLLPHLFYSLVNSFPRPPLPSPFLPPLLLGLSSPPSAFARHGHSHPIRYRTDRLLGILSFKAPNNPHSHSLLAAPRACTSTERDAHENIFT